MDSCYLDDNLQLFETCNLHPNESVPALSASQQTEVIHDNFDKGVSYTVLLLTYENGIPSVSATEDQNSYTTEIILPPSGRFSQRAS